MKGMLNNRTLKTAALCLMPFYLFFAASLQANEEDDEKLGVFSELGFEYTDNVFDLTEDQILTMNEYNPYDIISGRYRGIDSIYDYIIKPRVGIKYNTYSPFGGRFQLSTWLRYNYYLKNDDSGFPEYRVSLKNSIGKKGDLTIDANFIYGFKKKNYLSSVNDINENGNISRDERTYSSAVYDEYEGTISYRHEFLKDNDKLLSGLYVKPFTGYSVRSYNSCFKNRDRDTAFGGFEFYFNLINRVDLGLGYRYENVSSPDDMELILFDETRSGIDINSDGTLRVNAPLYTNIDRSRNRYNIEINPSINVTKDIKIFLGYSKQRTSYSSKNPLDIEHYNQKAHQEKYKAGVSYDLSTSWFLKAEYCRTDDEDPEDGIYTENSYLFALMYKY